MHKNEEWGRFQSTVRQFSIGVPLEWSVKELEDQVEIRNAAEDVIVIVSSFSGTGREPVDTVEQLQRFLDTARVKSKADVKKVAKTKASVEYSDVDDAEWYVVVLAEERRFLLITCNTGDGGNRNHLAFRVGCSVVESIELTGSAAKKRM
jgi:hypothetical protein